MPTVFRPGKRGVCNPTGVPKHGANVGAECIRLNEDEKKIFRLLRECCELLRLDITLRVAGGWVRDKVHPRGNSEC